MRDKAAALERQTELFTQIAYHTENKTRALRRITDAMEANVRMLSRHFVLTAATDEGQRIISAEAPPAEDDGDVTMTNADFEEDSESDDEEFDGDSEENYEEESEDCGDNYEDCAEDCVEE